jgi:hypothetical protein
MKIKPNLLVVSALSAGFVLYACGAPAATEAPALEAFIYAEQPAAADSAGAAEAAKGADPASEAPPAELQTAPQYNIGGAPADSAYAASHMIIKNADVKLLVEDTDVAIDRATQIVGDVGGYIISSRAWYQPWYEGQSFKYATLTIGVPVDQFERTLSRLRGLAVQVLDETASGEDVTDQFVDLQSQLTNLQATRDRIKSFLDQATNVDEALRINQELANVEAQIEEIQGRMNYLKDRSAYSTITVNFEPQLPEPVATPTPTPIPDPWDPAETFKDAKKAVTSAYQGIFDFLIWFFVVLVPILAPPAFILWGIWKVLTRRPGKPSS